jgi:anaerobic magnesium-protoporphyrin IX monomethyl ester cyclase
VKLCFITPPSVFLLDERVFVNLGSLKVAAVCIARGHEVEHLDLDGVSNFEEVAAKHANDSPSTWFCLTATTPQMPAVAKIARAIQHVRPGARLMIGGPHPTLTAAAVKLEKKRGAEGRAHRAMAQLMNMFDAVIAGDGEDAIEQALRSIGGHQLVDADDPKGPLFLTKKRMEELPMPARELVDLASYKYTIDGVPATSLVAQLGCPFNCSFCGGRASPMLRRARQRSTESVIAEIEHLHVKHGFRGFMLYDDELNVSKSMVELMRAITALQRKHGAEFRLRGFVKAELFTQEQAEAMYEAGFRWLLCGFEAGHPRILENIQKKATLEDNTRCLQIGRAAGLKVKALMSIGHAGESAETVRAVRDWLLEVKPDDFDCTIITPYPGSPYYDEATETEPGVWTYVSPLTGDRLHSVELDYMETADYYKGAPGGGYKSYVYTDHLSANLLVTLRDELEVTVRDKLNIPFNPGAPGIQYEASMGQLPAHILRRSA